MLFLTNYQLKSAHKLSTTALNNVSNKIIPLDTLVWLNNQKPFWSQITETASMLVAIVMGYSTTQIHSMNLLARYSNWHYSLRWFFLRIDCWTEICVCVKWIILIKKVPFANFRFSHLVNEHRIAHQIQRHLVASFIFECRNLKHAFSIHLSLKHPELMQ